jgi:hypothetical protein
MADAGDAPALALYLTQADPLGVLRDLLGHSSALTTQAYLRRLDVTWAYRDAHENASRAAGLTGAVRAEVDGEFSDDDLLGDGAGV